jgi:diguanylate cyclase (GGDEF)-like protein
MISHAGIGRKPMSTNPPTEGNAEATLAAHRNARRGKNGTAGNGHATNGAGLTHPADAGHYDTSQASALRQPTLAAAIRKSETLLKLNMALTEEIRLLTEALAQANRSAFHDELTGLPNRRLLLDHFEMATARAARKHNHVALLFIDLDRFKNINDSIGHLAADSLLQQVAGRLASCIRSYDTACRYGGDEFVVLLPHIDRREQAIAAQNKIAARLAMPYMIGGRPVTMTASSGLALYPFDGKDCTELLKVADYAMYHRKASAAASSPDACEFVLRE